MSNGERLQAVLIHLPPSDVAYMVTEMLTDELRTGAKGAGACTVARKLVMEAIDRHKARVAADRADAAVRAPAPGWPTKQQLMGRR